MTAPLYRAIMQALALEEGTRRIFIVEEFEQTAARGAACYVRSFSFNEFEPRDFVAEREIEEGVDKQREQEDELDGLAGLLLIEKVAGKPHAWKVRSKKGAAA